MAALLMVGCGSEAPPSPERYAGSDALFEQIDQQLAAALDLESIATIDHSRMGAEVGSAMPPARVVMFSDPQLDAVLLQKNPLVGIDLPFRVLAYEVEPGGDSAVITNSFEFLRSRYGLDSLPSLAERYDTHLATILDGIGDAQRRHFDNDDMQPDGIITIDSPHDFETTVDKVQAAIDAQDDTVNFGQVDFQERAREEGILIRPSTLILFGAPGPGAKAMADAPTLGLDAFCQKFLVWEDGEGQVHLSFNDLLAVAERQGVGPSLPLRVINRRLEKTFSEALTP